MEGFPEMTKRSLMWLVAVLAIFGLAGMTPDIIKPTVLSLNVVVGTVAVYKFSRAGYFSWRLIWPFILRPCGNGGR